MKRPKARLTGSTPHSCGCRVYIASMLARLLALVLLLRLALPAEVAAQANHPAPFEPPGASVAVLPTSLYNAQANLQESSDSAQARLGQAVLRQRLDSLLGRQVRPYPATDGLLQQPEFTALAGGVPCEVRMACALAVAEAAKARWLVLSKVSKTSNLIWLLSAQLVHVEDGRIVLDDSTELKGDPGTMVSVGMRQFADRVARTIRAGGVTTDFPNGAPGPP